jgi:signal transduction histidine kinase
MRERFSAAGWVLPAASLAVTVALAVSAFDARREHRAAAERVLRDYAGVAATEFVRRTAFDVGFNGFQLVAYAIRRSVNTGTALVLPRGEAGALARRVWMVSAEPVLLAGPAGGDTTWVSAEVATLRTPEEPFVVRHRVGGGRAETLVLVPLADGRAAAFEVAREALVPFGRRAISRGPLLPEVVGDGHVSNASLSLVLVDHAGGTELTSGPPREGAVEVPCGDFFRGVLQGSAVRVALDPDVAPRLLPGGVPRGGGAWLAALAVLGGALTTLTVVQARRERALRRLRDDFVASVSHELRTPLAQIRLFTETVLLGRARSPEEARACLEAAHRETLRLGHLVDNVLDFSRAERDALDLALVPRRLAPLVDEVVGGFRPLAAARGVRIASELDPEAGAAVDAAAFRQVILNLLDNAVKYGPEQGDVEVGLCRAGDAVLVSIADRGPGVPAGERQAIFRRFQRLDRDRRTAATGAGLGLAVVRELVARHGGSCAVEDREGGGARFVVRLPAQDAA